MGTSLRILLGVSLTCALLWVGRLVFIPLVLAGFLAITLAPVVDLLERHHLPRWVGAFFALITFFLALGVVASLLSTRSVELVQQLPQYSHELRGMMQKVKKPAAKVQEVQQETEKALTPGPPPERTVKVAQPIPWSQVLKQLGAFGEVLLAASFVPFLAYFWLSWQRPLREHTARLFPRERHHDVEVALALVGKMVRRFLLGNLILGLAMSALNVPLFWGLGIPNFLVVALVAGFLNLIPYLGVVVSPLLPLAAGVGHVHAVGALVIVGSQLLFHLLTLNLAYPKVVGARLQLNPLVGTLSLLVWSVLWGPLGLLLGIPLTAAIKVVCDRSESLQPWGDWLGE
jgi:predicted PurR-regulated permease PerM